jgi:hypothetical protein
MNYMHASFNKLGDWVEDWSLAGILYDLHNPFYAEVSEVDAAKIAKENFGVEFETVQDELIAARVKFPKQNYESESVAARFCALIRNRRNKC